MKIYQITERYEREGSEVYRLTNQYTEREQATNAFEIRTNMLLQSNEVFHILPQTYNNEECYGSTKIMFEDCSEIELTLIELTLV